MQIDEHVGLWVQPTGRPDEALEVDAVALPTEPQVDAPVLVAVGEDAVGHPDSTSSRTLSCSRIPARWVFSIVSTVRLSNTTVSMPARWSRWLSMSPAGPPPTIATCVRLVVMRPILAARRSDGRRNANSMRPSAFCVDSEHMTAGAENATGRL